MPVPPITKVTARRPDDSSNARPIRPGLPRTPESAIVSTNDAYARSTHTSMTTTLTDIAPPVVTDEQRRQLDEQGFFITDVLFDEPTLQGVRDGFRRVWDELIENAKKSGDPLTLEQ